MARLIYVVLVLPLRVILEGKKDMGETSKVGEGKDIAKLEGVQQPAKPPKYFSNFSIFLSPLSAQLLSFHKKCLGRPCIL